MVDIQSELGAIKIGLEMHDVPYNNNNTFPLVWKVVALSFIVASGCIGDNIFLAFFIKLAKNNTNTSNTLMNV